MKHSDVWKHSREKNQTKPNMKMWRNPRYTLICSKLYCIVLLSFQVKRTQRRRKRREDKEEEEESTSGHVLQSSCQMAQRWLTFYLSVNHSHCEVCCVHKHMSQDSSQVLFPLFVFFVFRTAAKEMYFSVKGIVHASIVCGVHHRHPWMIVLDRPGIMSTNRGNHAHECVCLNQEVSPSPDIVKALNEYA